MLIDGVIGEDVVVWWGRLGGRWSIDVTRHDSSSGGLPSREYYFLSDSSKVSLIEKKSTLKLVVDALRKTLEVRLRKARVGLKQA